MPCSRQTCHVFAIFVYHIYFLQIVKVCNYSLESDFFNDVKDINIPEAWGLRNEDKQTYVLNFQERIISSIKIFNTSVSPNPKRKS